MTLPTNMPYRHQEVLQTLFDHPNSTTAEVTKIAKSKPGHELPDASICSKIIYVLRGLKYVDSHDAACGMRHRITKLGIDALNRQLENDNEITQTTTEIEQLQPVDQNTAMQTKNLELAVDNKTKSDILAPQDAIQNADETDTENDQKTDVLENPIPQLKHWTFDQNTPLGALLHEFVVDLSTIIEPAAIIIKGKNEALWLLEELEQNPIFSGKHRSTFARIRCAVTQMEEA